MFRCLSALLLLFFVPITPAYATVFASLHGIVHDPQHRPIPDAIVTLHAASSDFVLHATSGSQGEFNIAQVPIGLYRLEVSASGFAPSTQSITIASGTNPLLHIPLLLAGASESVRVEAVSSDTSATDTVTPTTLITRA